MVGALKGELAATAVNAPMVPSENIDKSEDIFPEVQVMVNISCITGYDTEDKSTTCLQNATMHSYQHCLVHSASEPSDSGFIKGAVSSYIHQQEITADLRWTQKFGFA
ncbi:unnamed protein product [Sphenostylis stenocarpa]|uniref:Uncharacterized protein n=1 Tax=Sphenostylis stenocarpa TaxID=92480 RepID=A0AA86SGB3_9FABA|nr:unnamed protein product [Sphenostylis stenocarpa]